MAFIDFVRGLLNINPLERWSPQQAKLHPFITQQKFTGPFVPPMNLKASALTKTPAPGVQQAGRGSEQATRASRSRGPGPSANGRTDRLREHAGCARVPTESARSSATGLFQPLQSPPASSAPTVPWSADRLRTANAHDARRGGRGGCRPTAATDQHGLRPAGQPLRTGHHARGPATRLHHGPAAGRHPGGDTARRVALGPHATDPPAAQPGILPAAARHRAWREPARKQSPEGKSGGRLKSQELRAESGRSDPRGRIHEPGRVMALMLAVGFVL